MVNLDTLEILMRVAFRTTVLLGAMGALCAVSVASSADSDSTHVTKVVADFHKALVNADSAAVRTLLAQDAVILESGGMETRSEYLSHHLPGDIAFAKAVASTDGPVHVTIAGNTAWTAGTSTTQGTFNGRAINSTGAESMVLTKESAGWKIRSIHWSSRNRRSAASSP
jgi:ketosteroid isomerase-like protein